MPEVNKYQRGKIYKIVSNTTDDVYYGSTCERLSKRLAEHRRRYKSYINGKYGFVTSFKLIEQGNYDIVLVENYPCDSKEELNAREREHIENNTCVNKVIPTRTPKEYAKKHYQKKQAYLSNWIKENPEKRRKYKEACRNKTRTECGCGGRYDTDSRARHFKTKRHQNYIQTEE